MYSRKLLFLSITYLWFSTLWFFNFLLNWFTKLKCSIMENAYYWLIWIPYSLRQCFWDSGNTRECSHSIVSVGCRLLRWLLPWLLPWLLSWLLPWLLRWLLRWWHWLVLKEIVCSSFLVLSIERKNRNNTKHYKH